MSRILKALGKADLSPAQAIEDILLSSFFLPGVYGATIFEEFILGEIGVGGVVAIVPEIRGPV
jgi:hypothetical protein